jgi:hypothetical protein
VGLRTEFDDIKKAYSAGGAKSLWPSTPACIKQIEKLEHREEIEKIKQEKRSCFVNRMQKTFNIERVINR